MIIINFSSIDKKFIKVITDVRRLGKSSLLASLKRHFNEVETDKASIIQLNFEAFEFAEITDHERLYLYVQDMRLTRQRELRPLQAIADHYPKLILCMDELDLGATLTEFTASNCSIF